MTYSIEIQDYANRMIANGTKMTFEAICEMKLKSEQKQAKKFVSKKETKKYETRQITFAPKENANTWLAEKNRENAMKNLPSSLR